MKGCSFFLIFFSHCYCAVAQIAPAHDTSTTSRSFSLRAFAEIYYSFDASRPLQNEKAAFLYNHKRHNEVSINLALVKLAYSNNGIRSNLGLMAGTYPQYNLESEPDLLRTIYEANVGVRLSDKVDLWIDAGIMPSHIGFENAQGLENATLTRSILAENSPYYETGVKLSYKSESERWQVSGMILNGWQRIARIDGNNTPAIGTQMTFTPTSKINVNWSTFIGNVRPDSVRLWRYFNNFYSIWQPGKGWTLTIGLDYGFEQKEKRSTAYNTWYSPVVIARLQVKKWAFAGRIEYFQDKYGVIVPLAQRKPFKMYGYSLNVDRIVLANALWRTECRLFNNQTPYFVAGNKIARSAAQFTTSLAINFK